MPTGGFPEGSAAAHRRSAAGASARLLGTVLLLLAALVAGVTVPLVAIRVNAATDTGPQGPTIPLYGQQWQPWGSTNLGSSTSSVASQGCALTAATMLLESYGVNANPGALNQWLTSNSGYVDQDLLVWGAVAQFAQAQGVSVSYTGWESDSLSAIDSSVAVSNPVIAQVALDGSMHFVLITGLGPAGTLWINDPWFGDHTTFQSRYGNPATQIQSIRLYTGTPAASPQLTSMSAGGSETVTTPSSNLGTAASGSQLLALPYTTPTDQWFNGTPLTPTSWSAGQIAFTAPSQLTAGFVVVETATGQPNFWFPFTVAGVTAATVASISPTSGSGGSVVSIAGTGFQLPAEVTFGSAGSTSVTMVSPTELQALAPAGSGSQPVQVSDWMGTSPTASASLYSYTLSGAWGALVPVSPTRVCDTRPGNPSDLSGTAAQCGGKTLAAGAPLTGQVTGLGGIPATGVTGVAVNVTVTNPVGSGFLTVYPAGQAASTSSNLNFVSGETVANLAEMGVNQQGQLSVVTDAASADVIIDVEGYFTTTVGPGLYTGLLPTRVCDTRSGQPQNQCTGKTLGPKGTLSIQVAGLGGVPSGAAAAVVNVTATNTTSAGYLTVYPSGAPPTASNLNWAPGSTVANLVVASLNSSGGLTVYNAAGSTAVVVDVLGYYSGVTGAGSHFTAALSPTRICDTRSNQPANQCTGKTLEAGQTLTLQVTGLAGVPAAATAVVVNVTATDTTSAGYLTVFPSGSPPLASNLNWAQGLTVPNLVIATLSSSGGFSVYNADGSTDVVVDVLGWYS
ncbi:MAG: C39 family peptidase [Candidatus Dormibacteria bacterium]